MSTIPAAAPRPVEVDLEALLPGEEYDPLAPSRGMVFGLVAGTSLWLLILAGLIRLLG
jgi:hypothetical protein